MSNKNEKELALPKMLNEGVYKRLYSLMKGRSMRDCARKWQIPHSTLVSAVNRTSEPRLSLLLSVSAAEKVTLDWLATGQGVKYMPDSGNPELNQKIVQYDLTSGNQQNQFLVAEDPIASFDFSEKWLQQQGLNGKHLTVVPVTGDSMEPTLSDGDLMLVEVVNDPKDARDGICVFKIDDEIMVKRVQYDFESNGYHISSDNEVYHPFFIGESFAGRFKILGRMVRVLQKAKRHQ